MAVYLTGTLLSFALFPFFPSLPPRTLADPAVVVTRLRRWKLWLVDAATIHRAAFPSAHVSSASAAWGLFAVLPRLRRFAVGDAGLRLQRAPSRQFMEAVIMPRTWRRGSASA
jgi:membrane-associated phospholipid phosphatase